MNAEDYKHSVLAILARDEAVLTEFGIHYVAERPAVSGAKDVPSRRVPAYVPSPRFLADVLGKNYVTNQSRPMADTVPERPDVPIVHLEVGPLYQEVVPRLAKDGTFEIKGLSPFSLVTYRGREAQQTPANILFRAFRTLKEVADPQSNPS